MSRLASIGWHFYKRMFLETDSKGRPTSCGILFYNIKTGNTLVLHPTNASWSMWSYPKGLMNKGESSLEAALRETKEETGIEVSKLNVLSLQHLASTSAHSKKYETFLCIFNAPEDPKLKLDWENDKGVWIPLEKASKYIFDTQKSVIEKAIRMIRNTLHEACGIRNKPQKLKKVVHVLKEVHKPQKRETYSPKKSVWDDGNYLRRPGIQY